MDVDVQSYPCIHVLLEGFAQETPDAVALMQGTEHLTYAEFNGRANQMANLLIKCGVRPGAFVGVLMERSLDFAIAILGALKAGAAYLPLTPTLPPERISFILQDAGVEIVLSHAAVRESDPALAELPFVCIDEERATIAEQSLVNPALDISAGQRAYVSYTSGSTGQPKGVIVPHRSMLGFILDKRMPLLAAKQVTLQNASIMWDAFVLEFWAVLCTGGTCVLYEEEVLTADALQGLIELHGISVLWLTSSVFNVLIDQEGPVLAGVSLVMVGGEALSVAHVARALTKYPGMRLLNGYGPSECVVFSSCYAIPHDFDSNEKMVPIGTAIGDRRLYVLDAEGYEVEGGELGELYVGGPGVALGYLNRPELTARHFLPDPFSDGEAMMYRTGDLVRRRPDQVLEFHGRVDQQVKIRGNRVELLEIEAVLQKHPDVQQVAVALCTINGQAQLVGYVVSSAKSLEPSTLRAHMAAHVPSYMIPSQFCQLEQLPLTVNGKLDRMRLPVPEIVLDAQVAPRTETERQVAAIWAEVLGISYVGVETHFLEIGGNSLLATQVHLRLNRVFGLALSLKAVLSTSTAAKQAILIEQERGEGVAPVATIPQMVPRKRQTRTLVKQEHVTSE